MAGNDDLTATLEFLTSPAIQTRMVTVQFVPDHLEPPVEVWRAHLPGLATGANLPLELMAELVAALQAGDGEPAFTIEARRSYTEWGASGAGEQIFLVVAWAAASGAIGNAAYDALRATVIRLVRVARDAMDRLPEKPLSESEAAERGRWVAMAAFDLGEEEAYRLAVVGAESRVGGWVIRYSVDDRRYEVELLEEDGFVTVARVGWSQG